MKKKNIKVLWLILIVIPFSFISLKVNCQIIPDTTLPTNSSITLNDNTFTINGGTTAGNNLFHSFQELSLPTGREAFFNNASNIQHIFSRVTGGNVSNIDGLIRANGTANLFFINPNGIIFGQNARLNIGGSFIGSTANSIIFDDGFTFSATNPQFQPLLTFNIPIGLQIGQNSEPIMVQGIGHNFSADNTTFAPINRNENTSGLQVKSGNTLTLLGGDINLDGGLLKVDRGHIEIGSIGEGIIGLNTTTMGWSFSYDKVQSFRDINLSGKAALDASGFGGGSIQIVGRQVKLTEGAIGLIQNEGELLSGNLTVNASELLELIGTEPNGSFRSSLVNQTLGAANGGQIKVSTRRLQLLDGAVIWTRTFGSGTGGDLYVNASESIEVRGFYSLDPTTYSFLGTWTFGSGNGGNVTVLTQGLTILDGGSVSTPSIGGAGKGGILTINASDSVMVSGITPTIFQPASIGSATTVGGGGIVTINTSRLVLKNGGIISTSTLAQGLAGSITINALDSVEISGVGIGSGLPSRIESAAPVESEAFRKAFGLPDAPSGNSGTVTINTPRLTIADGARVSVANQGTGIAGNLNINAGSIRLDSAGNISAATASGEGGNINITTDFLQLRRASQISTQAGGTGNGGNLNINANTFAILEGSEVNANAFQGTGGNIQIDSQGLFASPDSQITASSQLGVSGSININSPEVNTTGALIELPQNPVDPTQQVVAACTPDKNNSFTVAGRGGLSEDPTLPISSFEIWADWNDYTQPTFRSTNRRLDSKLFPREQPPLVEATSWRVNANGQVELYANVSDASNYTNKSSCR
ncbi:filamentous hemagglutinin N-terminal domain-containing protein [Aerosakkonema sp. BLCC-F183]|uniref:two-partner secretion domain-containing protein n=1 Tax=Aerosakkonema sp. BLCC-F183 TaxID=3342834 RepID=UPI0035BB0E34